MSRDPTTRILFAILLVVVLAAALQVIAPFLPGFTWAAVLVAAFRPFHQRLERTFGGRRWVATTAVTLLVAAFVMVPLAAAAIQAAQGSLAAFQWIQANYQSGGNDFGVAERWPWVRDTLERGKEFLGIADVDFQAVAIDGLKRLGLLISAGGPALLGGAFGLAFSFAMMLLGVPVLLAHGTQLTEAVADALPIPTADAKRILEDLTLMTRSVFISVGVTAAAQAALGGIALFVLGVPYAVPLTATMFFCALIPAGTAIVWLPAAIWLAAIGDTGKAILLAVWGAGVVSTIDNLLRPLFAGKGTKVSGLTLFLGMFGGMAAFGLVGLFLGPILLYMTRELLRILRRDVYEAPPRAEAGPGPREP
jgi:predicted PurR-regulated permease PerM